MIGGEGLAQGIVEGFKHAQYGMNKSEEIKQNRQAARQNAELFTAKMNKNTQEMTEGDLRIQEMDMKLKELQSSLAKRDVFDAFSAFDESGDAKFLNQASDNPIIKQMLTDDGVVSMSSITDFSPTKLEQLGYVDGSMKKPVIVNKSDGSQQVVDLIGHYAASGYLKKKSQEQLEMLTAGAKLFKEESIAGKNQAQASKYENDIDVANQDLNRKIYKTNADVNQGYQGINIKQQKLDNDINKSDKELEIRGNVAESTIDLNNSKSEMNNLEYDDASSWLANNPDKTLADYKATAKVMTATERKAQGELDAITIGVSKEYSSWLDKPNEPLMVNGVEQNGRVLARQIESKSKAISTNKQKYISDIPAGLSSIRRVRDELSKLTNDEYNQFRQAQTWLNKFVPTGNKEADNKAITEKLSVINASATTALLDYVTMKTGAAFSESEMKKYQSILFNPILSREQNINSVDGMLKTSWNTVYSTLSTIKKSHPETYLNSREIFDVDSKGYSERYNPSKEYKQGDKVKPGDIINGFRYKGGDTTKMENYEKVN